nr:ribonuclease H [Tanacetum cinerariifolium]
MVAILEKGEFNTDFHPMVDFIAASPLRIETTDEGTHILATVDGIQRIMSEASLRRNLKLRDEDGIVSIPDTELFENLTLMGYHFIKELVENGVIELYFVNIEYQLANLFTKALGGDRIEFLTNKLGMRSFTPETLKKLTNDNNPVFISKESIPPKRKLDLTMRIYFLGYGLLYDHTKAFLVTADVPEIYMQEFWAIAKLHQHSIRFKMDTRKHVLDLEAFREMLHISPRISGPSFAELPFEEEILEFFSLRISQAQILWGLYNSSNVDYAYLIWEDFVYQVEHKNQKKSNEMYCPRFTKLIIDYFMTRKPSIPRRNRVNWHYVRDDVLFSTIKVDNDDNAAKEPVTAVSKNDVEDQSIPSPTPPTPPPQQPQDIPSISQAQSPLPQPQPPTLAQPQGANFPMSLLQEALDACDALARRVENLEHDKMAQDLEIIKLKTRVKKLERTNKGRIIDELDKDEGAVLMSEKVENETKEFKDITGDAQVERQADIYQIDMDHAAKVLNMQEDEPKIQEAEEVVTTAKLITEVVAAVSETVSVAAVVSTVTAVVSYCYYSLQQENDEFLRNIDENMKKVLKGLVKNQVKEQVSRILPRIEESVNATLEAEVLTRSSYSSRTSYAIAADLSEVELKKILIGKMEGNKSIQRSDEQQNLYKALVEAYKVDKAILDTYGDSTILKRRREDDDQEGPSAGPNRGSERQKEGGEQASASIPSKKATKGAGGSTTGTEEAVNAQLEAEVLTRSSHSSRMSYAVAADLSEMELKKILIDKMEGNKSIQRSDEQRNLYKALVEAYDADKTTLDTYGESTILKRRREDNDQEGPSAGSDRGSKRQREGGEHASASTPSEPATRSAGRSTTGSQSRQLSASEFAFAEEPVQTTCQMEEPSHPMFETGAEDQPIIQTTQHPEWFS